MPLDCCESYRQRDVYVVGDKYALQRWMDDEGRRQTLMSALCT